MIIIAEELKRMEEMVEGIESIISCKNMNDTIESVLLKMTDQAEDMTEDELLEKIEFLHFEGWLDHALQTRIDTNNDLWFIDIVEEGYRSYLYNIYEDNLYEVLTYKALHFLKSNNIDLINEEELEDLSESIEDIRINSRISELHNIVNKLV